jgi:hypothetical protein
MLVFSFMGVGSADAWFPGMLSPGRGRHPGWGVKRLFFYASLFFRMMFYDTLFISQCQIKDTTIEGNCAIPSTP